MHIKYINSAGQKLRIKHTQYKYENKYINK